MSFQELHTIDLNIALGMMNMSFNTGPQVGKFKVLITSRDHQPQGVLKIGDTVFVLTG